MKNLKHLNLHGKELLEMVGVVLEFLAHAVSELAGG